MKVRNCAALLSQIVKHKLNIKAQSNFYHRYWYRLIMRLQLERRRVWDWNEGVNIRHLGRIVHIIPRERSEVYKFVLHESGGIKSHLEFTVIFIYLFICEIVDSIYMWVQLLMSSATSDINSVKLHSPKGSHYYPLIFIPKCIKTSDSLICYNMNNPKIKYMEQIYQEPRSNGLNNICWVILRPCWVKRLRRFENKRNVEKM